MKTKNLFGILMLFLFTFTFISCDKDDLTDKVEIVKMYVSAETDTYTPWGSETPIECMLVKEEGNASYSKLPFSGIDGFVYKKGIEYTLKVEKTTLDKMNLFYKYFDNTISCLKDQLFYLEYNEDFNSCFLKELESSCDTIKRYIEIRIKLDAEEKNRDKHVTNVWLSLGEIPNERKKETDVVYEYVKGGVRNQITDIRFP